MIGLHTSFALVFGNSIVGLFSLPDRIGYTSNAREIASNQLFGNFGKHTYPYVVLRVRQSIPTMAEWVKVPYTNFKYMQQ